MATGMNGRRIDVPTRDGAMDTYLFVAEGASLQVVVEEGKLSWVVFKP